MGIRNYLIDGVSGSGKTTVAEELQRRGYHVLHGDRELVYRGDPETGAPVIEPVQASDMDKALWQSKHHIWNIDKVKSAIDDQTHPVSFFCGGSQNLHRFIDLFDGVFILEVADLDTINQRIAERVARDPTDWGAKPEERELVAQMHQTKLGIPKGDFIIDATAPVSVVVDDILSQCGKA